MTIKMTNIKKVVLSLLVVGIAVSTQAFKNAKPVNGQFATGIFYNISGIENNNPQNYVFSETGDCLDLPAAACSATWNYTLPLTNGHPNGSKVSTSDEVGTYDGN